MNYNDEYSLGDSHNRSFPRVQEMSAVCPGCGENQFIEDYQSGDRICTSCGRVVAQNLLSEEPEWRTYKEEGMSLFCGYGVYGIGNADDDARVDTFTNSYLQGDVLSTEFMLDGKNLSRKERMMMKRMEKPEDVRKARKLVSVHSLLEEAESRLDVTPAVTQCAFNIYNKCLSRMQIRGKRIEVISAACLYIGCRISGQYRLLSEIVYALYADLRKVSKLAQLIITELQLSVPIPSESDTIRRYCCMLVLSREISDMSVKMYNCIREGNYPNLTGTALPVVTVLMASRLLDMEQPPSVSDLSVVSGKSEQSIIRMYKSVYTHCDSILVSVYKEDLRVNAKTIMKLSQKLEPKRL